jgi:hypothetical protein
MMPVYFLIVVLVIGLIGFTLLMAWGKKSGLSDSQRTKIKEIWNNVELLMADDREASWAKAVFEADKLLDYVMTLRRVSGNNLGERLKNGRQLFSNVQSAWDAHKLRNQLAHEVDMKLMRHEADRAIRLFKDSLRQLGAKI